MASRSRGGNRGFTLSEILISLALVSLVATALLAVAQTQVRLHRQQDRTQRAQDNARAALDVLAHDARLLGAPARGYGMLNGTGAGPPTVPMYNVIDNDRGLGPDRLELVVPAGEALATATPTVSGAAHVDLARLDPQSQADPLSAPPATRGLAALDYAILSNVTTLTAPPPPLLSPASACSAGSGVGAVLLQVRAVTGPNTLSIPPLPTEVAGVTGTCSFPRGSLLVRAIASAYYIDDRRQLVVDDGAPLGAGSPPGPAPVAESIADLQIAVGVDGLDGSVPDGVLTERGAAPNDDEWAFNVPGEALPAKAPSALRITIVARSSAEGAVGPSTAGRPAIEDHEAGAADGFRYRVLTTTVAPRNLMMVP